jgi:hypothetical protein
MFVATCQYGRQRSRAGRNRHLLPRIFGKNIIEERKEMYQILIIKIGSIQKTYSPILNTAGSATDKHVTVGQYCFEVDMRDHKISLGL